MIAAAIATMATVEAATSTPSFLPDCPQQKLGSERNGPRSGDRFGEASEHHKISVEADALDTAHPEEREAVVVLQPAELALDGKAASNRPRGSPGASYGQAAPGRREPRQLRHYERERTRVRPSKRHWSRQLRKSATRMSGRE
jgi:hypothetical protein